MKNIFNKLWELAKPYYLEGRPTDIDHIRWMMNEAEIVCQKEKIDDSVLLPLVILHDIGYSESPKDNPFKIDMRKLHMAAGTKIAKTILDSVKYPQEKIDQIVYFISVHDNWALDDHQVFNNNPILGIFNDLECIWGVTTKGFNALMGILNKNQQKTFDWLKNNDKPQKRPFATETTKNLYYDYMSDRKQEIQDS